QTAKMNRVGPYACLKLTLERIAQGWSISQIDDLMPGTSKPKRSELYAYRPARRGQRRASLCRAACSRVGVLVG
ncbi:MAG: transposase domain-containing protein, partial [Mesorhizobium sp.]